VNKVEGDKSYEMFYFGLVGKKCKGNHADPIGFMLIDYLL